jgi:ubiquinone/menaquinone biosynthesis C-methylase UbiE
VAVVHRAADAAESARANRRWWDGEAPAYQAEHGAFLGDADLLWCPEGLREADVHLLGDVRGRDVLEVGCGAAQGARWLVGAGARVTAFDVSHGQLLQSRRLDTATGVRVERLVQADAQRLPFRDSAFDVVMSAFGGIPFVADSAGTMREVCRVLRPGGRFVFSVTHPVRWVFPDDPGPGGLTVQQSTSTGRRTSRWTSAARRRTSSTTAPPATGCASSSAPAGARRPRRTRVARGARPRVGAVVAAARPPAPGTSIWVAHRPA